MMVSIVLAAALTSGSPDYSALMKAMHVPGIEVVVLDRGKVVQSRAFGLKNLESKAPVDLHTRFEIGSITKQFTAAAVLQLKERGKLSLDDKLGKYLPQYLRARNVTLRQMLLQISGIPDYTNEKAFGEMIRQRNGRYVVTRSGSLNGVLALIENHKLDFKPGTKWAYSNSNYYLLGRVVEIAAREPWADYVTAHIFKPAGMTESTFMEDEPKIADMATGYVPGKNGLLPGSSFNGWAGAAGTIVSTASDLAKWDDALFGGTIVSAADLKIMTAPGTLPAMNGHYGFGWVIDTYDGQPRIWHDGGTLGFNASNQIFPRTHQAVIVLSNGADGADAIAQRTFDALHPDFAQMKDRAAAGEDAAVTARAKALWKQITVGPLDRAQLTGKMSKDLTPELLAQVKTQLASLGSPSSWVYKGKSVTGGTTSYSYSVKFTSGTTLDLVMSVDKDGKISSYALTPG